MAVAPSSKIIVTVGPSSIGRQVLSSIKRQKPSYYRINLSHSNNDLLEEYLRVFQALKIKPSVDTQGAQIRIVDLPRGSSFKSGQLLYLGCKSSSMSFSGKRDTPDIVVTHPEAFEHFEKGQILKIGFEGFVAKVHKSLKDQKLIEIEVLNVGPISNNKAIDISGKPIPLSSFSEFDYEVIGMSKKIQTEAIFISFCSNESDVNEVFRCLDKIYTPGDSQYPHVIAKIENKAGLLNLANIARRSDGILIDRGDLSREIKISNIPLVTSSIIETCVSLGKPCYVATNVLDSMISGPLPSRAEISDIYNLFRQGVSGLVLAAEVAIGNFPVECIQVVKYLSILYQLHKRSLFNLYSADELLEGMNKQLKEWL